MIRFRPSVSVLIPAYNEAERIVATLKAVHTLPVAEIIVVDDGSKDGTGQLAAAQGAKVLTLPENRGKGAAVQAALPKISGEIVLLLDADLGTSACQAMGLLPPVYEGRSDMTLAAFSKRQQLGGGLGLTVGLARWSINHFTGQFFTAPLSGQRAIRSDTMRRLQPLPPDFGFELGLTLKALKAGLVVTEIPLPLEHRVTGSSLRDIWHRARQFYQISRVIIQHCHGWQGRRGLA